MNFHVGLHTVDKTSHLTFIYTAGISMSSTISSLEIVTHLTAEWIKL